MTKPRSESNYQLLDKLEREAWGALQMGDTEATTRLASEMLARNTDTTVWCYGNIVHSANQLLGLTALRAGDVEAAKGYLLTAGHTPGSPQLDSFGPDMTLAQELLAMGEKQAVLDYLDLVATFWAAPEREKAARYRRLAEMNAAEIASWKVAIRAGEKPELNRVGADAAIATEPPTRHNRETPIADAIASLTLIAVDPSGQAQEVRAEVGRPHFLKEWDAACPCALWGLHGRFPDMRGGDTMQALGMAMGLLWDQLRDRIENGWKLYLPGDPQDAESELTAESLDACFGRSSN